MKIFVYNETPGIIIEKALELINARGLEVVSIPGLCDVAIAPLLTRILSAEELKAPRIGTLVMHPSLLPRHAGPDAIKWAFRHGEKYSGVTWFWASDKVDGGAICEQQVLEIAPGETPRVFYHRAVIPAAIQTLGYALQDMQHGHYRMRPQRAEARTYEPSLTLS